MHFWPCHACPYISHYSPTDVPKSYVHDLTLCVELHMNGTVYATL